VVLTGLIWLRIWSSGAPSDYSTEPSGSINLWKILEWLQNWRRAQLHAVSLFLFQILDFSYFFFLSLEKLLVVALLIAFLHNLSVNL
jgi:hypothetical protein